MSGINSGSDIYEDGAGGGSTGIVETIVAGTGISVDSTDPANPIVTNTAPGSTGIVETIVAGAGISVDSTDPANPIVTNTAPGGGGVVVTIGTGVGISVDETDPANPIVSSDGLVAVKTGDVPEYLNDKLTAAVGGPVKITESTPGGGVFRNTIESNLEAGTNVTLTAGPGNTLVINSSAGSGPVTSDFGVNTFQPALSRSGLAIPNVNNGGAVLATYVVNPASFVCRNLSCIIKQAGSGSIILAIYNQAGTLLARTLAATPGSPGIFQRNIALDGAGGALTEITLMGGVGYYFALHGTQAANGAQFFGVDAGTTFGSTPYIGWVRDNQAAIPATLSPGSESAIRFSILAKA
jgi:hypothetical protein